MDDPIDIDFLSKNRRRKGIDYDLSGLYNPSVNDYFNQNGIIKSDSPPYIHEINGKTERINQPIRYACHIYNKMPHQGNKNLIPDEVFFGKKKVQDKLKVKYSTEVVFEEDKPSKYKIKNNYKYDSYFSFIIKHNINNYNKDIENYDKIIENTRDDHYVFVSVTTIDNNRQENKNNEVKDIINNNDIHIHKDTDNIINSEVDNRKNNNMDDNENRKNEVDDKVNNVVNDKVDDEIIDEIKNNINDVVNNTVESVVKRKTVNKEEKNMNVEEVSNSKNNKNENYDISNNSECVHKENVNKNINKEDNNNKDSNENNNSDKVCIHINCKNNLIDNIHQRDNNNETKHNIIDKDNNTITVNKNKRINIKRIIHTRKRKPIKIITNKKCKEKTTPDNKSPFINPAESNILVPENNKNNKPLSPQLLCNKASIQDDKNTATDNNSITKDIGNSSTNEVNNVNVKKNFINKNCSKNETKIDKHNEDQSLDNLNNNKRHNPEPCKPKIIEKFNNNPCDHQKSNTRTRVQDINIEDSDTDLEDAEDSYENTKITIPKDILYGEEQDFLSEIVNNNENEIMDDLMSDGDESDSDNSIKMSEPTTHPNHKRPLSSSSLNINIKPTKIKKRTRGRTFGKFIVQLFADLPDTYEEAMRCVNYKKWEAAIKELNNLYSNNIMTFFVKEVPKEKLLFLLNGLKFIIALASKFKWDIFQLNIKAAYLNAPLDKEIYTMELIILKLD
ncbi:hypothetical protein PIROE2DRAFT_15313 [Piromyces sp. E2]|nr:hypothetical protein PIROE2DRAFT_15313 [Piromyces sp. E2]|eukprot:OUM59219.1 hypothetical protein PIROE2DRAFT_15313 [Piromyces sp. E2]